MKLNEITNGLTELLHQNHYNERTLIFYKREWDRIENFLRDEYGDTEFNMERGLQYLEKRYQIPSCLDNGTLTRQRVQLIRVVNMLEDYRLHGVITRRYHANKNPVILNEYYGNVHSKYVYYLSECGLSNSTVMHYTQISKFFMDYLTQKHIDSTSRIKLEHCTGYLESNAGYTFKTIEQIVCGLRHFLRFLFDLGLTECEAEKLHMPNVPKGSNIPSAWKPNEISALLATIDRNNPIGKRDYAMILLACCLGLRAGDIKNLHFNNFDWGDKKISLVQHKTHKSLILPLPDAVGWAVIDYVKNGRPSYMESDYVFIKHMPPFDHFSDDNHLNGIIRQYLRKAKIKPEHKLGFHSLRHSAGSIMLEMDTELPVISQILGHTSTDTIAVYLKTDLERLRECVLDPEELS